jgi:subtilisin-like proprotein convertase family protein
MKNHSSNAWVLVLFMAGGACAFGQVVISVNESSGFSNSGVVPDYDLNGWSSTANVNSPGNTRITGITVSLEISADASSFNSDLYGYLASPNGSTSAVLLNRVGQTTADHFGYMNSGFNVTFAASAAHDIHEYQDFSPSYSSSGQLLGTWQPDGRALDPAHPYAVPGTSRSPTLDSFLNQNPNGNWTLFLADLSSGGQSTVVSWGMQITAVPEPGTYATLTGLGLTGFAIWKRSRRLASLPPAG